MVLFCVVSLAVAVLVAAIAAGVAPANAASVASAAASFGPIASVFLVLLPLALVHDPALAAALTPTT